MKKQKLRITIRRDIKGIYIYLKAQADFENFFKNEKISRSAKWQNAKGVGIDYYSENNNYAFSKFLENHSVFSDFGKTLIDNYTSINIGILRAVGISKGIKMYSKHFDELSNLDIDYFLQKFANITKRLWREFLQKKEVKVLLTYEV